MKKIFYDHIKEKEDITWYGGFYVTNGILNYKKRTSRPKSCEPLSGYINTEEYNRNNMPVLKPICELADETHKKQLVGTLYYNYNRGPKLVYLNSGECSNNGWEKVDTRIVLRAPYLMWFKWLNKEI